MRHPRPLAVLVLLLVGAVPAARAAGPTVPPPRNDATAPVPWTRLELRGSKFFMTATTTVEVIRVSAGRARPDLRQPPDQPPVEAGGPWVDVVRVSSRLPFGKSERATVWLDGASGAVLQMEKRVGGGRPYWKLRRFVRGGYHEWREAPASKGERGLPRERWTKHTEKTVHWDAEAIGDSVVTDSYALLYLVSRAHVRGATEPLVLHVVSRGRLVELRISPGNRARRRVSFVEVWPGGSRKRSGQMELLTLHGVPRWLDDPAEPGADTGFMGMRGPLTILVEPALGIPCRVEGSVKGAGHLTVKLTRVELREAPSPVVHANDEDVTIPTKE